MDIEYPSNNNTHKKAALRQGSPSDIWHLTVTDLTENLSLTDTKAMTKLGPISRKKLRILQKEMRGICKVSNEKPCPNPSLDNHLAC